VIRMAIGQRETERHHVEEAWSLIRDAAKAVSSLRGAQGKL
jgi:hypothetical protein